MLNYVIASDMFQTESEATAVAEALLSKGVAILKYGLHKYWSWVGLNYHQGSEHVGFWAWIETELSEPDIRQLWRDLIKAASGYPFGGSVTPGHYSPGEIVPRQVVSGQVIEAAQFACSPEGRKPKSGAMGRLNKAVAAYNEVQKEQE